MSIKAVLVLERLASAGQDLVERLEQAGWQAHVARDLESAAALSNVHACPVGIALLGADDLILAQDLRRIATKGAMEWVAVVPKEALSGQPNARLLVENFHDFHTLPVDFERLLVVLGHALGKAELSRSLRPGDAPTIGRYAMVGRSPKMLDLYRAIDKMVRADAPVLISGESGTGKELAARAIHQNSPRSRGPFITVNCGALPVNLVQSELFGHEKGAFTGAHQRRLGSIECAEGGTILLDEIGDLPLESQASLLRFLQEKTIARVGSTRLIRVDARVVAASHTDLSDAVRRNRFREDLFYRLNVLHLPMPALRDRPGDVTLIAQSVFHASTVERNPTVVGFAPTAVAAMEAHAWPGNVRELINRVQKAMIMCDSRYIGAEDLGLDAHYRPLSGSLERARAAIQRDLILQALEHNGSNMAATARQLGVSRVTLYRLIRKLEIERAWAAQPGHRTRGDPVGRG